MRSAGIGAVLVSLVAGMTSNLLFLAAFQFRLDWFDEPTRVLGAGATSAELVRWASALDMIGYYLATGVLAYVLWRLLRPRSSLLADVSAICAVGYALAGGAGAAVLAMVAPMLMHDYTAATPVDRVVIGAQFAVLVEMVVRSIWQFLDPILLAVWWLGIGLLIRADLPGLSRLSLVLGTVAAIGALANLLGLGLLRDAMLGVIAVLWTGWWVWLLVRFVRHSPPAFSDSEETA